MAHSFSRRDVARAPARADLGAADPRVIGPVPENVSGNFTPHVLVVSDSDGACGQEPFETVSENVVVTETRVRAPISNRNSRILFAGNPKRPRRPSTSGRHGSGRSALRVFGFAWVADGCFRHVVQSIHRLPVRRNPRSSAVTMHLTAHAGPRIREATRMGYRFTFPPDLDLRAVQQTSLVGRSVVDPESRLANGCGLTRKGRRFRPVAM
jgi:hypothetical protein